MRRSLIEHHDRAVDIRPSQIADLTDSHVEFPRAVRVGWPFHQPRVVGVLQTRFAAEWARFRWWWSWFGWWWGYNSRGAVARAFAGAIAVSCIWWDGVFGTHANETLVVVVEGPRHAAIVGERSRLGRSVRAANGRAGLRIGNVVLDLVDAISTGKPWLEGGVACCAAGMGLG